jgi:hypothetical protein
VDTERLRRGNNFWITEFSETILGSNIKTDLQDENPVKERTVKIKGKN